MTYSAIDAVQEYRVDDAVIHKTILVGDSGVGKTSFLVQFDTGKFQPASFAATVGIGFTNKTVTMPDSTKVKLQIWDTAGQERFRSITHAYYRDAHALLLLYDVTSKASFDNIRAWLAEIHDFAQEDAVIILIGNKADMSSARTVRKEDGERLANVQSDFPKSNRTPTKSKNTRTQRAKQTEPKRRMRIDTDRLGARVRMRPARRMKLPPIEDLKMKNTKREGSSEMEDIIPSECEITPSQFHKGYTPRFNTTPQKRGTYGNVFDESPTKRSHQKVDKGATNKLVGKSGHPATESEDVHKQNQRCEHPVGDDASRLKSVKTPVQNIHQSNLGVAGHSRQCHNPGRESQLHKNIAEQQASKTVSRLCRNDVSERHVVENAEPLVIKPAPTATNGPEPVRKKKRRNKFRHRSRRGNSSDSDGPSVIPDSQDPPQPVIQNRQITLTYETSDSEEERPYQLGNTIEGVAYHNLPSNRKPVREPSPIYQPLYPTPLPTPQSQKKEKILLPTQIVKYDDNGNVVNNDDSSDNDSSGGGDKTDGRISEDLMNYLSPVPVFDHSPSSVSREAVGTVNQNFKSLRFETPGKGDQIVLVEDTPESQYRNGSVGRVGSTEDLILSSDENEDGMPMPGTQQF